MCGMWQSQQRCPCLLGGEPPQERVGLLEGTLVVLGGRARAGVSAGDQGGVGLEEGDAGSHQRVIRAACHPSCSQSSLVHHRECHNRFSCSQIPVSHFTQSQTIDRTCMSNMCGAALHLDMTTLARVGHKPQPQGLECAASLARHKRNRASVNGHYVAARSLSWAVTGEPRGPLEAFLWRSLLRQFPLANIRRGGRGAGWCDGR